MTAYYNEIDPFAAQWLRNLIDAGHIAPGIVDERSIEDVRPSDLAGFRQCHFFAGIGVWSLALRRAGWPDDRPVWTGSCPCQPFSAAGAGAGFDDERHLWPHFHWLIEQCRPATVIGEQVASKDADPWIDLVQDDLEALDYAFGAVPFPSAGVGASHIRDRLYWVADADGERRGKARSGQFPTECAERVKRGGDAGGLGHAISQGLALGQRLAGVSGGTHGADQGQAAERAGVHADGLAHADGERFDGQHVRLRPTPGVHVPEAAGCGGAAVGRDERADGGDGAALHAAAAAGPTNGLWRAADWLLCRDGKWRPVEPGTFPLAHGAAARVGRLRAYGNAINAEAAWVFIEAVMEAA